MPIRTTPGASQTRPAAEPKPIAVDAPSVPSNPTLGQEAWAPQPASLPASSTGDDFAPSPRSPARTSDTSVPENAPLRVSRPPSIEGKYFDKLIAKAGLTRAVHDGVITPDEAKDVGIAFSVLQNSAAFGADPLALDGYQELLTGLSTASPIVAIPGDQLLSPNQCGDYVVLAPRELQGALEPLLNHRALGGHKVALVDPEDVYAHYGQRGPGPLGQFVQDASKAWGNPKPKFLVLVGAADSPAASVPAFDETKSKLLAKAGKNSSKGTTFPSDNRFGDLAKDAVPELAVGRLPVHGEQELATLVSKIVAYEALARPGLWQARATLVEGDPKMGPFLDAAVDFFAKQEMKAAAPASMETVRVTFNPKSPMGRVPELGLADEVSRGGLYIGYTGHGSPVSVDGLSVIDAFRLKSSEGNPVVAFTACLTGAYKGNDTGLASLAETMVLRGPAIAAIGASDITLVHNNAAWSPVLAEEMLEGRERTVGEAFRRAKQRLEKNGGGGFPGLVQGVVDGAMTVGRLFGGDGRTREDHLYLYNLFGDPATELRRPAAVSQLSVPSLIEEGQPLPVELKLPAGLQRGVAYVTVEKPIGHPVEKMEDVHQKGITKEEASARSARNAQRYNQRAVATMAVPFRNGVLKATVPLPPKLANGEYVVRVAAVGEEQTAVGSQSLRVGWEPSPEAL